MPTLYLSLLGYSLFSMILIYLVGKIILIFFTTNLSLGFRLFLYNVVGIITIIIVYSLVRAKLQSVNIGLIPIVLLLIYSFRDNFSKPSLFTFIKAFFSLIFFLAQLDIYILIIIYMVIFQIL